MIVIRNKQLLTVIIIFFSRKSDYTLGIFQSIGFKEFHQYLLLSIQERQTDTGKQLFAEGILLRTIL